jgi:hypothetical protein
MNGNSLSKIAYGTINPFTFVQDAPGILNGALQCSGPGVPIIGIAQEWTDNAPGTRWQQAFTPQGYPAAASGEPLRLYQDFDQNAMVMVGSGQTVEPGSMLVSDASGYAVQINLAASGQQWVGARAIEGGVAGDVIRVAVYTRFSYHS